MVVANAFPTSLPVAFQGDCVAGMKLMVLVVLASPTRSTVVSRSTGDREQLVVERVRKLGMTHTILQDVTSKI